MPWIGLKYVIVIIPDHTCLHFNGSVHQSLILITKSSRKGSDETAHLRSLARAFENRTKKMAQPFFIGQFKKVWY